MRPLLTSAPMGEGPRHGRGRWLIAAGAVVGLLVVALVVVKTVVFRDKATAVSTEEAVDRYRTEASSVPVTTAAPTTTLAPVTTVAPTTTPATSVASTTTSTTTVPPAPVTLVEPGVYRYTGAGQEHVDALN